MLSRTADQLYWMSRYIERAESLARLVDAHNRMSPLPHSADTLAQSLPSTMTALHMDDHALQGRAAAHSARRHATLAAAKKSMAISNRSRTNEA